MGRLSNRLRNTRFSFLASGWLKRISGTAIKLRTAQAVIEKLLCAAVVVVYKLKALRG